MYVYEYDNGVWSETDALMASDASAGDGFAFSLSMYRDVSVDLEAVILLVGAPSVSAAYVMIYDPRVSSWMQHSKLTSTSGFDEFGYSVCVYDGVFAIGSPQASGSRGGVTVYQPYNASNKVAWAEQSQVIS